MIMREPYDWRWSHTRHHTDTDHRRPRPGDRRDAAAGLLQAAPATSSASSTSGTASGGCSATPPAGIHRRGGDLRPRDRNGPRSSAPPASGWRSMPRRSRSRIWLGRCCRCCHGRPAAHVRRAGIAVIRAAAARRARRQRARPSAELAHRLHEPDLPLPLLEHELPHRAPHVPDGALPRAAGAARADQARLARRPTLDRRRPTARSCRRCCASSGTRTTSSSASCRRRAKPYREDFHAEALGAVG